MRELLRPLLPMIVILAVPIVPFLFFGASLEAWLTAWKEHPPSPLIVAAVVISLLAGDVLLPVPSSLVSTLAGWQLGPWLGTLVTWLGMNLGAWIGFALARRFGPALVSRLSKPDDLARAASLTKRLGPTLLAVSRGVPVLAEATVLWLGMHRLTWRAFWPPVLAGNLVLAAAYGLLGFYAEKHDWLPMALAASVAIPVALAAIMKGRLKSDE